MLEARILSPRGSLYYVGESHPYDFETIWDHLRDVAGDVADPDVELELVVDDVGIEADVSSWVQRIAANGVHVRLLFARLPSQPPFTG